MDRKILWIFIIPIILFMGPILAGSPEEIIDENGDIITVQKDAWRVEPLPTASAIYALCLFFYVFVASTLAKFSYYSEKVKFAYPEYIQGKGSLVKPKNPPIPRSADIHSKHGIFWTYSGFNRGMTRRGDKVFVVPERYVKRVGETIIFVGRKTKLTSRMFYEQLKALNLPQNQLNSFYQDVVGNSKAIYTITPLTVDELNSIKSLEGNHDFSSDRFDSTVGILKERLSAMILAIDSIAKAGRSTLTTTQEALRMVKGNKIEIADGEREGRPIKASYDNNDFMG